MGYLLVVAAGALQGSFMVPMKFTRRWAWENTWLGFTTTAYLVWPWLIAWATLPHLLAVYTSTSHRSLVLVELFGLGWGLGALTFGLGVDMLGLGLGFTIILGLSASAGTLIPLAVLFPEKLLQPQGLLTMAALLLVLGGIALSSWAGKLREAQQNTGQEDSKSSFGSGLIICIASGLLSSSGNLGFAFGGEVIHRAIQQGAAESMAGNSLWALITMPLFLVNTIYCCWLLKKRRTGGRFFEAGTRLYWVLAASMGLLWIAGFVCYAPGVRLLGPLGPSVGWAIMLSAMVITANLAGFLMGEWKGASWKAYGFLLSGVVTLLVAIGVVGYANHL
ncbi:MAG: L-rhamnose/proton symporter RhaT [Terriglobia bacterium]|jgi:L-rhamnose-H+ transport protein